ncbi:MAG TPA: hypothetical protein VF829_01855 [Candidatus Paceibacterota bacterium]
MIDGLAIRSPGKRVYRVCPRGPASAFLISVFLFTLPFAFPAAAHAQATSTVISKNTTFAPGEYFFDTLTIASSSTLTLNSDPNAASAFKGVIIHAQNLTIEHGSRISADMQGYEMGKGPGVSAISSAGSSYGGVGAGNTATSAPTYGSVLHPTDLGSGGYGAYGQGGGAIQLIVSGTLTNDGTVSANAGSSASGGSIYVETGALTGAGSFQARGGGLYMSGWYKMPGGGGRITLSYDSSSFSGATDASGLCATPYGTSICGGNGTVAFIDRRTNTLNFPGAAQFLAADSPISFSRIVVHGSTITSEPGASISADSLVLDTKANVSFGGGVHLHIPTVRLDGASTLSLADTSDAAIDTLTISGNSKVTTVQGKALDLSLGSLSISSGSSIDVSGKGYAAGTGPGAPILPAPKALFRSGASYGGVGYQNTATSTYGDPENPTDFGSGGTDAGGGALSLTVSGMLTNNGTIAANGSWSASGGSILVHAKTISGSGVFSADGANKTSASYVWVGGGGRIALYALDATSTFSGAIHAKGACTSWVGSMNCGTDGTVTIHDTRPKYDNVLFLPGIEGSTLYDESAKREVWLPGSDEIAESLRLNTDGTSINPNITASGILSKANLAQGYHTVYGDLLEDMEKWEAAYHIIATSTPYDWRLGYDTLLTNGRKLTDGHISYLESPETGHDPYLIETLKQLAASSATSKVTIIAHSNGGLLAKALMQKLGATTTKALIDNVILVASPQLGTPDAIGALLHGHEAGIVGAITNEEARDLAQNMPMTYNLLPSTPYFTYADDPVVAISSTLPSWTSQYGSAIHWAQGLNNFIRDSAGTRAVPTYDNLADPQVGNADLLAQAQEAHAALDTWTPPAGVHLYTIAGWGNETVSGIEYEKLSLLSCFVQSKLPSFLKSGDCGSSSHISYAPQVVIDGDGTVVAPSALWANGAEGKRYWVDLDKYNGWLEHHLKTADLILGTHHDNIFNVPELRTLLASIVAGSSTDPLPQYISTSQPTYTGDMARLHFILHSPLTLGFLDANGNYTGATATSTVFNIPGVEYQRFGEVQWLSVPKSLTGTVVMHGIGTGSFSLDVEEQAGNTIVATTTFAAIPSATSTTATLIINPSIDTTASSTLNVDANSDGKYTISVTPEKGKTVVYEPPAPKPTPQTNKPAPSTGSTTGSLPALFGGHALAPNPLPHPIAATSIDIATTTIPAVSTTTMAATDTMTSTSPVGSVAVPKRKPAALMTSPASMKRHSRSSITIVQKPVKDLDEPTVSADQVAAVAQGAIQQSSATRMAMAVYNKLHVFWAALAQLF